MDIGYRYECSACGRELANTAVLPDGSLRGDGNPAGFFPGRRLNDGEVPRCPAHPDAWFREAPVEEPPGRFARWMEAQEAKAQEAAAALKPLGFFHQHTGGGCTSWEIDGADGTIVTMTDGNLSAPEKLNEPCDVGWYANEEAYYSGDGEVREYPSVRDFLAALQRGEVKLPAKKEG